MTDFLSPSAKNDLRALLRARRNSFVASLSPQERLDAEQRVAQRLQTLRPQGQWASYVPMGSEFDPHLLVPQDGTAIAYPWFADRAAPMRFRLACGPLLPGPFRIRQPEDHCPEVEPDTILTPMMGFDAAGNRIGQGAGHYDRALEAMRARRNICVIGIAWDVQQLPTLPADPWDQPLDAIITPDQLIRPLR